MKRNPNIVPALMFHSAGLEFHPCAWSHISEPMAAFEVEIAWLKARGLTGEFWTNFYDHLARVMSLPENSILLTFDHGCLDNWMHIYPILRKYELKGAIFVNADFVDPVPSIRPNMDDLAAGRCRTAELPVYRFLNWAEMREMERSGLVDIQSPDDEAMVVFTSFVAERGGRSSSTRTGQSRLEALRRETFPEDKLPETYESDAATRDRVGDELQRSKQLIEQNLEKAVVFICWPSGLNDEKVEYVALEVGFKAWTLGSQHEGEKRNWPGTDPISIQRIWTSNRVTFRGRACGSAGPEWQIWKVLEHQGSLAYSALAKGYKASALLGSIMGRH